MSSSGHYDLAVVGGGIAGLYCCLNAPAGTSVALFEATGRVGGRIETSELAGFRAEWGSMRFDPERQYMMKRLVRELQIETEPFPEYSSPTKAEERIRYGLEKGEMGLSALDLFARCIGRVLHKTESELMSLSEEELERLRRNGEYRNKPLWDQGLWNVFADVLSPEAIRYIMMDGSFFHGIHENPGVAGTMITWVKMLQMSKRLKGVNGGMQLITDRMFLKVKERGVAVYHRHTLKALSSQGKQVTLEFDSGKFTARHVILALPSRPLKAIKGIPENVRALLGSVIEYPLLKCFFVVRDHWWEGDASNVGTEKVPTRELHYYKQGGKGMIMVYADRPAVNYWRPFLDGKRHDSAEIDANIELPAAFAKRMNISPESVLSYGIRDWTRDPYGAGVHLWKPGVKPWEVSEALSAFSLTGSSPRNVHICGEAFSGYQGFMEGAVRSAQGALTKAMN